MAHLEGLINKLEFQSKKEALLKRKVDLEAKIAKLEQGASVWLEPAREFLEAAHQAEKLALGDNLEAQRDFFKKIGLNPQLAAKSVRFSYTLPCPCPKLKNHNGQGLHLAI